MRAYDGVTGVHPARLARTAATAGRASDRPGAKGHRRATRRPPGRSSRSGSPTGSDMPPEIPAIPGSPTPLRGRSNMMQTMKSGRFMAIVGSRPRWGGFASAFHCRWRWKGG